MIVMMVMTMMLGDVVIKFLKPAQRKTLVHMLGVFGEVQHLVHHLLHLDVRHHHHHPHPHDLHCHHRRCHDDLYYQVYEEKTGAYN